ncbi:MAG: protein phosphatase 2C domain-containing protein, partial [Myxococcota bacterium]
MIDEMRVSHGVPLRVAIASDVGRVRDSNEDSFGHTWLADGTLFVMVADGMGGHAAGEVASGIAVQVLEEVVARDPDADPRERLFKGLLEAHDAILQEGRASGMRGMGTTAIVSLCLGAEIYVALVGDSRLYHVRKGHPMWRTSDHTRVQMLVEQGLLQQSEVTGHVEYGKLTRALGHPKMADGRPLTPDVLASPIRLLRDDALVLCSDGLHDLVQDGEIGQAIAGREPADAARELVRLANERGGHDNVTVAVIVAGERTSDYDASYVPEAPTWARTPVAAPEVAPPPVARPEATWSEPRS